MPNDRGLKAIIPVNPRNRKNKKVVDPKSLTHISIVEEAVERFNSWIEANKKINVRHDHLGISYMGLILLAFI